MINNQQLLKDFEKKLILCYQLVFIEIGKLCREKLREEDREYPHITFREFGKGKTGKVAGEKRDVIDSGNLYQSYWFKFLSSSGKLVGNHGFSADYAATIYLGHLSGWGYDVEPYPWIEIVIEGLDIERMFLDIWNTL